MPQTRREFLKLMTTSALGAVLFTGCQVGRSEFLLESPARIPEDLVSGIDNQYATVCRQCPAGCGILVRVMEGRAKKIEGNPDFPINGSKHDAGAEAALQALYHPDRILGPMKRRGDRGSGQFDPVSWDAALDELHGRLAQLVQARQGDTVLAIVEPMRGHRRLVVDRFITALGAEQIAFDPLEETAVRSAVKQVFGQEQLPDFAIDEANYVLSFGADFLGTWLSPVRYGRKYGEFRQGRQTRGTLVQVEPRFSVSAANADIWVPIRPGTEGVLALSLAQVVVSEGLGDQNAARAMVGTAGPAALDAFRPERAAEVTGVSVDRIRQLARDFAGKRPSLAIGGGPAATQTNGLFNLQAIFALNFLAGAIGSTVRFNPGAPPPDLPGIAIGAPFGLWQRVVERIQSGQPRPVNLALVHNANPVYGLPAALGFRDALVKVPYIVSFSSFIDETTALADLILPDHVFLEDWGSDVPDPGPGYQVVGFQQPVVRPVGDTRGFVDVLLTLAEELGGELQRALPWNTFRDVLRTGAQELQALRRGSVQSADFEDFWVKLLQRGGWWDERGTLPAPATPPAPPALPTQPKAPRFAGDPNEFRFNLIVFPSSTLLGGGLAHLPWLQALPDPTTTVVWQSWLEINPKAAAELGIRTGDLLAVESPNGRVEVPAYLHPAAPPEVVAIPLGQGHTRFTRYAGGRGVNPLDLLAPLTDEDTGALALGATRVRVRKTGRSVRLTRFEGTVPPLQPRDAELVPIVKA